MSTVAEQLRSTREARKLTVYQIAETTKIRTDYIRALEDGNYEMFSAPVYIRGSVKNYAKLLKLNVPAIMVALNAELGQTEKFKEPPPFTEESKTVVDRLMFLLARLNWKIGLVGGVVWGIFLIIALAGFAWRHHKHDNSLTHLPPAVYQPASPGETLPLPSHR